MPRRNLTQNQHYLSQSEQRLNALNPNATPANQKLFAFHVTAPDRLPRSLDEPKEVKIENNLASQDLFSYDVIRREALRSNLEGLFSRYEGMVSPITEGLLTKVTGGDLLVEPEVINLFKVKYMNVLRNPHLFSLVPDLVDFADGYKFTNEDLAAEQDRVDEGNKPHDHAVQARFGITAEDYRFWLRALYMLLEKVDDNGSAFDRLANRYFTNSIARVEIFHYDNDHCLLSDHGCNVLDCSSLVNKMIAEQFMIDNKSLGFEFNLTKRAFIRYIFLFGEGFPPDRRDLMGDNIIRSEKNDLYQLVLYNQEAISQCSSQVYCADRNPLLSLSSPPTRGL